MISGGAQEIIGGESSSNTTHDLPNLPGKHSLLGHADASADAEAANSEEEEEFLFGLDSPDPDAADARPAAPAHLATEPDHREAPAAAPRSHDSPPGERIRDPRLPALSADYNFYQMAGMDQSAPIPLNMSFGTLPKIK